MKSTGSETSSMAGDSDSSKGDFRNLTVGASMRTFMDYKKVPNHVAKLLQYINEQIVLHNDFLNINKLALKFHYQLVTVHPFADGNGQMSRLMLNYAQQFHKTSLTIVYEFDKQDYINALLKTRTNNNIVVFIKCMFEQTEKFLTAQIATRTQKQDKKNPKKGFLFMF